MACHFIQRGNRVLLWFSLVRCSPVSGSWLHAFDILVVFWRHQLAPVNFDVSLIQSLRVVCFCRYAVWILILILQLNRIVILFSILLFWLWRVRPRELSILITIHSLPLLWTSLHCYLLYLPISSGFGVSSSSNIWTLGRFPNEYIINAFSLFQGCFSELVELSLALASCEEVFSLSASSILFLL